MKKVLSLALTLILIVGVLVLPASAATSWSSEMSNFKPVSEYYCKQYPDYLWALQRFLFAYPDTQDEMSGSTHEGVWGSKTRAAVGAYQRDTMGGTPDYIVGPNTWSSIATKLYADPNVSTWIGVPFYRLLVSGNAWPVFMASRSGNSFYYFYGTTANASVNNTSCQFHPYS